ncbi:MAG: hypothetical protein RLP08_03420 [Marinovum algicola]|uniref:hypothetical protein n=1 Tax=Marinovum algicola TaxID=42444 RepID=UPI0032EF0C6E
MKDSDDMHTLDLTGAMDRAASQTTSSRLEIDLDHYQSYLDDPDLTADQKTEIVTALWAIITAFVELGFGVHPAQQACGKPQKSLDRKGRSESTKSNQEENDPDLDAPAI